MKLRPLLILAFVAAFIAALVSCSPKKNTALSRNYQAFITRYNIHYNGDTHYRETLEEMEKKYDDDYSRLVFMHPIEAKSDPKAPQPTGNFDRSIEKAQKAIQLRSVKKRPAKKSGKANDPDYKAWMKREEYNPFLHNSWMMMGRSQYMNGDFLGAASTFFYVSKHFSWLPATVTEARLWQARSYVSMGWLFEAETILTRIKPDELTSKELRYQYNFTFADFYIHSEDYAAAIPYLQATIKDSSGAQKIRLNFLLGQLYARTGQKELAYQAYGKAGGASSATYRTKFNARIKQSEVYSADNIEPEVKALRRMTRYDRNKEYLDQVYYAIGNLYLSRRDTLNAIENYELAAEKSTRDGIDKAISQITLGGLYFDLHKYNKAQPCYAGAVAKIPDTYPDYAMLKRRSDVLDELAVYSQNVQLQDSLLRLSNLSEDEQMKIVKKIIADLVKKEKEEADAAKREEYMAQANAAGAANMRNPSSPAPNAFNINADNSWYFYNPSTVSAGKSEFQRKWGSRKLEDDWRRRNKTTFDTSDFDAPSDSEDGENADSEEASAENSEKAKDKKTLDRENDPHFPEFYLKQIPKTDLERQNCNDIIQEGLYNMGLILKDKLDDYPSAITEFNTLMHRYPDNIYRLDVYYNMYLMMMREHRTADAERWRQLILTDFPESKYGQAMLDPEYLDKLREMEGIQERLYQQTYEDYLAGDTKAVHAATETMEKDYPLSKIMPKFLFLNALTYATEHNSEKFNATLRDMLDRYPDTDIAPIASSWLKGMAQGRKLSEGAVGLRGMLWDTRLTNDSTATAATDSLAFSVNPNAPQLLVLLYPTDRVATNALLYEIARFNFSSFVVRDFDLEPMNFGRLGMIVISGFNNERELRHYRQVMDAYTGFKLPPDVRPIEISRENFDLLLRSGASFEDYFRFIDDDTYRTVQEQVLPPEEYGPAEAIPEPEPETEHEVEPEVEPEPAAEPLPVVKEEPKVKEEPTPAPEPKPAPAPEVKEPTPAPTPTPKPEPKPEPKPVIATPAQPVFPAGTEGDDPDTFDP